MKKLFVVIAFCALVFTSCSAYPSFELNNFFETLTSGDMMGRAAGSFGGRAAAMFITETFEDMGYDVSSCDFSAPAAAPETFSASLYVNGEPLVYMKDFAPTRASNTAFIESPVTFDIFDEELNEKILVTDDISSLANAQSLPKGIITKGDIIKYVHAVNTDIPVFCVTKEIYQRLAQNGEKKVSMAVSADISEKTMTNIIAEKDGTDEDTAVIVSAHFDGCGFDETGIYQSAVDNASGVAAMMRTADILKDHTPSCDIVFCAFDGEETGLFGSSYYVASMPYENVININIDCIEKNSDIKVMAQKEHMKTAAMIAEYLDAKTSDICGVSDDLSFYLSGHKAVLISTLDKDDQGSIHTKNDTYDMVDMIKTEDLARDIAAFIKDIT